MKQATIKDIAASTGLSVSTISRALNNHPDINSKTKILVRKVADEIGYQPNILAQSLKSSTSKQIGVIVPEIKHDFFAKAISGIEEIAYNNGYTVIIAQSNEDFKREIVNLNTMRLNRVAGIILSLAQSTKSDIPFRKLIENGTNIVFFDRVFESLESNKVIVDDKLSSYESTSYLIELGYSKIVHLSGPETLNIGRNRRIGYEKAMKDAGLVRYMRSVSGGTHELDGYNGMDKILKMKSYPEAVVATTDFVAIGALKRIWEAGLKVPDDIALVGFSNSVFTELVMPPLTTVEQPAFQMGQEAAKLLLSIINSEDNQTVPKTIVLPTKLIIRKSA